MLRGLFPMCWCLVHFCQLTSQLPLFSNIF
jgi:hypothetical protein